ncbi:TetR/AcrR family transcriptional regulator [Paenibacillus polymyxa]|uniref:TetR/AcrR family transcriptional regulator n=1 Tax=Paenibacillus TaxID=44249 RepID=UPI0002E366FB|nr:TetR/AcrR family transcriptional regulator [Paenibacillus polymyxa]MEB4781515.1 TetR/AcrR family transcriptional regulator [Paenibacillus jamilae]MBE3647648.1 TetR/AcrR family transcriptional regulator [Paenibacillus polymyxa]MDN4080270.1 TetR/AcrR family transcriptional regulator [Paenibacillus polymyxa]MDN4105300.1 TetR/AcrR family transcriptional regulator [Paenibacillus polymyxa]MDN4115518.1 TetR/AcrR family transcriptional regulator [Paenibacillus polymyxa]
MTLQKIKTASLKQFARKGYDAASLQLIADEVGIKKQSIYAHFKSKDDLFLDIFADAVDQEILELDRYFQAQAEQSLEAVLRGLIIEFKERYESAMNLRLILYVGFLIPSALENQVQALVTRYVQHKTSLVYERLAAETSVKLRVPVQSATIAYMNLIEGMLVELVYNGTAGFDPRLESSWDIYWHGLVQL